MKGDHELECIVSQDAHGRHVNTDPDDVQVSSGSLEMVAVLGMQWVRISDLRCIWFGKSCMSDMTRSDSN